ncbi:hypothetical protein RRG08_000503 [Elysia crispata]|uniref:Uncharacterized protein n=1 Tax=Elysia crispata TaxID=231223 RepID=A0AAE1CW25_9GAST|nr:hypothetical protein RRG08_000503 [Elysia crispata]
MLERRVVSPVIRREYITLSGQFSLTALTIDKNMPLIGLQGVEHHLKPRDHLPPQGVGNHLKPRDHLPPQGVGNHLELYAFRTGELGIRILEKKIENGISFEFLVGPVNMESDFIPSGSLLLIAQCFPNR